MAMCQESEVVFQSQVLFKSHGRAFVVKDYVSKCCFPPQTIHKYFPEPNYFSKSHCAELFLGLCQKVFPTPKTHYFPESNYFSKTHSAEFLFRTVSKGFFSKQNCPMPPLPPLWTELGVLLCPQGGQRGPLPPLWTEQDVLLCPQGG